MRRVRDFFVDPPPWVTPKRIYIVAGALVLIGMALSITGQALAHHIPEALNKPMVIKRVYPDLWRLEMQRKDISWTRLRKQARTRWNRQHPIARYAAHPTPAGNRYLARLEFGAEYDCAAVIINGETGGTWRHDVAYGFRYGTGYIYSGLAYGLGQARPGTKMLRYGADAASNPATQLRWFRAYAEARYGSVCGAAAHWTAARSW